MIVKQLHEAGLRSEHACLAAVASIGLSLTSWPASNRQENVERADRWGIFVGEWAPTFFGLGLALANYERDENTLFDQSDQAYGRTTRKQGRDVGQPGLATCRHLRSRARFSLRPPPGTRRTHCGGFRARKSIQAIDSIHGEVVCTTDPSSGRAGSAVRA